ncbi:MAG: DivIVA domain-containing protein [Faecousia sp.]
MITPQQIDQISFSQARHGYDMEQVDKILEPLTEDYVALYKENALLKSKMRVLVGKLEEYRKNEAAAKDAVESAKRSAEQMVHEAEAKCAQMMRQAKEAAAAVPAAPAAPAGKAPSADAFVAVEKARVAEARKTAAARITEIQTQMQQCIQALDRIKNANVTPPTAAPAAAAAPVAPVAPAAPKAPEKKEAPEVYDSEAVAGEISQSLEAMVGTTTDTAPKAPPQHPTRDTTTSRFSTLNLQFGRNYDPTQK